MLGDEIGGERGKVTGYRILPSQGAGPKVEVAFQAAGKILGVDHTTLGTYTSITRPDGTVFGEGQGVVMGAGGEMGGARASANSQDAVRRSAIEAPFTTRVLHPSGRA